MNLGSQAEAAIRLYESRAGEYDFTWHPSFTKRFASHLKLSPGQHILDLACGTGLLTFLLADASGPTGRVVGVDITPGMLRVAQAKRQHDKEKYNHVEFCEGDILNLDRVEAVRGCTFDVITLASALVLFPDPVAAIKYWKTYLKPGGIIAMDSTHPNNLIAGITIERTAERLDLTVPYYRTWSTSETALQKTIEAAGLKVQKVVTIDNQAGYGKRCYEMADAEDLFVSNVIMGIARETFAGPEIRRKAHDIFIEEFEKIAVKGKVEEVDAVFLGIAQKPIEGSTPTKTSSDDVVFSGGCRCGSIKYTSTATPSAVTICYCRACQQLSGSGSIAFIEVPTSTFNYSSRATLRSLRLTKVAERTFCGSCGAPITMTYNFDGRNQGTSITMGSVDLDSLRCAMPKVTKHIFLKEKAPWMTLPDDGAEREETSAEIDKILAGT